MSITVHSKRLVLLQAYPQYAVDPLQISNQLRAVEHTTFHNRKNYSTIRTEIPAGTEICGVILRKSTNAHAPHAPAPNAPPDDPRQIPRNPDSVVVDWYSNFKFLNDGREDSSHGTHC